MNQQETHSSAGNLSRPSPSVLKDPRILPGRFLVVSNRLPYEISERDGKLDYKRGMGGLVTALDPILHLTGGTWIGWPGGYASLPEHVRLNRENDGDPDYHLRLVSLTPDEVEGYYLGYANKCLWPLFHFFQEYCEFSEDQWTVYKEVNHKFANAVIDEYREGDLIWIHDYHLLLAPAMIRKALPEARIGFFLHIPFPPSELALVEPHIRELVEGLLGADLVGFHVDSYARNFIDTVRAATEYRCNRDGRTVLIDGREVRAGDFPISIASDQFEAMARRPETDARVAEIRDYYHADILALGVDRLDYTKGILERLQAIELMLERYPELQGRFTFAQISAPSRTKVHAYQEMRDKIERMVGRINGRFGARGCLPVDYRYEGHSQEDLVAYYRASDLALVTPLRDGMNLIAKEYIASRVDDGGTLLLSRFAGARQELDGALMINPYAIESLADRIVEAIRMPQEEKERRMKRLRKAVRNNDVYWWLERFLRALS
jgi:alpha,alpha-trehalose-phosphate synthase [UDP-forming]